MRNGRLLYFVVADRVKGIDFLTRRSWPVIGRLVLSPVSKICYQWYRTRGYLVKTIRSDFSEILVKDFT